MSSSTATISSKNSTMNNNDRKRPISSSIRPSPSPPLAKRHGLSTSNSRQSERNDILLKTNERQSRSKQQQYRQIDNKSSSSESSRSSSNSINQEDKSPIHIKNANKKKFDDLQTDTIYTKKTTSLSLIVKPSTNYDSDEDYQRTKQNISTKSVQSVMTIVTKNSNLTDNVIISSNDVNSNSSTKLVKLVVPPTTSSSSIKMLSSGDGFASALRVPTKIQLTKPLLISSEINDKPSSLISSTTPLLDIPIDITDKQSESNIDYHSTPTLPPTPPPPVIDNRNIKSHNRQQNNNQISSIKATEQINCENSNNDIIIIPKRHSSSISDWSVPPTSELSPASLTSSSPDLTQNIQLFDDTFIELKPKQNLKRRYRSLSFPSNKIHSKSIKSKSLTRLSNNSDMKVMLIQTKRSLTTSPILKLSSSQRIKKRRRINENLILNQQNDQFIIKDLLNEIIERISPTPCIPQANSSEQILSRPIALSKKSYSSLDSTIQTESRSMIMTQRELDELAYLLHANVHRGEFERITDPTKVEERMREMWSQMSIQKKNSYYKRVIQIYKRPNRDVVIASTSSSSVEIERQTSTPLSFHSIPSSKPDEQIIPSPQEFSSKSPIFNEIVNELIKGAKGLDKLSCTPTDFINSIQTFVQSTTDKQIQTVHNLEQQVEKKCSIQLHRAIIFWTQKIQYFAAKYLINSSNESMNELTLVVKYFYLLVLSLNCRKQEIEFESALTDLVNGNLTFINESFCSVILTSIIEDLILRSSLANDYLLSQPIIINNIEHSLPLIRNTDLENELLNKNDTYLNNPFSDLNDLENYLNHCEHITITTTNMPSYPIQQSHHSSMFYPTYSSPYYYPPDMNNYYYNSQSVYPYGQSSSYYSNYYYNAQNSYPYPSQSNSNNDIPLANNSLIRRTYRQNSSNLQNNPQQPSTPSTPTVYDTTTAVSPQSKTMNTITNNYPP